MSRPALLLPLAGGLLAACASVPVPATRSPENPAHPAAAEAVTPAAGPELMGEAEEPEETPRPPQPPSHEEQAPHGTPGPSAPQAQPYSCPMHPEVRSDKPGICPVCGMSLAAAEKPKDDSR